MLRFSLASLLIVITLVALATAALLKPNVYFATSFHLTMVAAVLASVYLSIFSRGSRRRLAGGFAVFVIGMQLWPLWFGDSVYLNNRIASWIGKLHGQSMNQSFYGPYSGWNAYPPTLAPPSVSYDPYISPSAPTADLSITVTQAAGPPFDFASLQVIVGSLVSILAGLLGMLLAYLTNRDLPQRTAPN